MQLNTISCIFLPKIKLNMVKMKTKIWFARPNCFKTMRLFLMHTFLAIKNRESCLRPVLQPFKNSDQDSFQILLCQMDISTFF